MNSRTLLALVPRSEPTHSAAPQAPSLLDAPVRFPVDGHGSAGADPSLDEHLAAYGQRRHRDAAGHEELIEELAAAGLTGRGGGHFPASAKWRSVRDAASRRGEVPVVVANAAEGEPASAKDAALLSRRPHLVLDGLADAAEVVGAPESVVWLHGDAHELHRVLVHALRERRAAGTVEPQVRLATGPSRYLTGESSAVVRALSGGPALPEYRREPTAVSGVHGRPTLVQNTETLARVGLLARTGADGHRASTLVTVLAGGSRTVLDVSPASRVRDAVRLAGWPDAAEPQAVLVGGYGGTWLPWDQAADLELDERALRAGGLSLGAGVLAPLARGTCGVAETARLAAYLSAGSARQCGPCLFGLSAIATTLEGLRAGSGRRSDVTRLQRWAGEVAGRGACHHPDGAVRMVLTAMVAFAGDVEAHRRHRPCAAADAPGVLPVPVEET